MEHSDFFEGVRSLLINKDNKPVWKNKAISEIKREDIINKYFERHEEIEIDPEK
jgi:hypothetical protein